MMKASRSSESFAEKIPNTKAFQSSTMIDERGRTKEMSMLDRFHCKLPLYVFVSQHSSTKLPLYITHVYWLFFAFDSSAGTNLFLTAFTIWLNQYTFRRLNAVFPTK